MGDWRAGDADDARVTSRKRMARLIYVAITSVDG